MKLFAQIAKVDEEKRLVFGRAAEEAVDKSDEIMDYLSSKPHFQKWSADIAADTEGKNLGNVRAMHGKVAAGALTGIDFNDTGKVIDVVAKIVDDNEWKKVLAGVYTGFSVGGSYVGDKKVEKVDGKNVTRYTAKPTEISLVDRPCMPGAKFFEVQKIDGTVAKVEFKEPEPYDVTVKGTADDIAALGKLMNELGLSIPEVTEHLSKTWPPKKDAKNKGTAADNSDDQNGDAKNGDTDNDGDCTSAEKVDQVEQVLDEAIVKVTAEKPTLDTGKIPAILAKAEAFAKLFGATMEKAAVGGDLQKLDTDKLQKLIDDKLQPLQKVLDAANEKIAKLEAQPAKATINLRAIGKSDDVQTDPLKKAAPLDAEPIIDGIGDKHDAAGIIKALHSSGGAPLHMPR